MSEYVYGAITSTVIFVMVGVIDNNIPNDLWYYIDTYLPF